MTIRIGVIGVGMIGQDHIRRLTTVLAGSSVVAVADADAERAREVSTGISGCVAVDAHELIRSDNVDAIIVTSWGETHAEYVLAALSASKPVFCEKPLATTQEDCRRIVAAEVAIGRRLVQVGFMRRYDDEFRALHGVVSTATIGEPLLMHCAHRVGSAPGLVTAQMVNDVAVHEIDTIRWMFGEEIVEAQAFTPRHNPNSPEDLADPLMILLGTESGILADIEVSANGAYGYDIRGEVVAQSGTAALPEHETIVVKRAGQFAGDVPVDWRKRFARAYDTELQEWVDRLAAGLDSNGPSSWDGLAAAATTDAVHEALRTGGAVAVHLPEKPELYC